MEDTNSKNEGGMSTQVVISQGLPLWSNLILSDEPTSPYWLSLRGIINVDVKGMYDI